MKKLKLALNDLRVESYATADVDGAASGTIKGYDEMSAVHTCGCPTHHGATCNCPSDVRTCGCPTYGQTCDGGYSCYNTCNCWTWSGAECNTVCVG